MHVNADRGKNDSGHAADGEQEEESKRENKGESNRTEPRYIVATQLNTLIAVGTPTSIVMKEKKIPATSDCPLTNRW